MKADAVPSSPHDGRDTRPRERATTPARRTPLRPAVMGAFGPAQLACLRSWRQQGWQPLFVHTGEENRPPWIKHLAFAYLQVPQRLPSTDRATLITGFLERYRATGITCVSYEAAEWLHSIRDRLPPDLELWTPTLDCLPALRSKTRQLEIANRVGFRTLTSYFLQFGHPITIRADDYPAALRPANEKEPLPRFKVKLVNNVDDTSRILKCYRHFSSPIVAQRFLEGPNLVVHGVRSCDGRFLSTHQAFIVRWKYRGVSLTIEPTTIDPSLDARCRQFVSAIGIVGIYHFEFIMDLCSGKTYFLEINGRLGGTTNKALACGYDEPTRLVAAWHDMTGERPLTNVLRNHVVCTNKRAVIYAIWDAIRGKLTRFDYPSMRAFQRIPRLLCGLLVWRGEIYRPRSPVTSLAYTLHSLAGFGARRHARHAPGIRHPL